MKHEHITWPRLLDLLRHSEELGRWQLDLALIAIEGCGGCRQHLGDLLDILDAGEIPEEVGYYDLALARSRRRARREWSHLQGASGLAELERAPASYGLVELLVEHSSSQAEYHPKLALAYARLALSMAGRLPVRCTTDRSLAEQDDEEPLDPAVRAEFQALAWGAQGNVHLASRDFREAEEALEKAVALLEQARGSSLLDGRARVLALRAALLAHTERLNEAIDVLNEAASSLREDANPDVIRAAEIALQLSILVGRAGDMDQALATLRPALQVPHLPSDLTLAILHRFSTHLVVAGTVTEVRTLLPQVRAQRSHSSSSLDLLQARWLEARIASAEDRHGAALETLQELQGEFVRLGRFQESALVALEVTLMLENLGQTDKAAQHAREALSLLVPLQVSLEAMIALSLVARLASEEALRVDFLVALLNWVSGGAVPISLECTRKPR